MAAPTGFLDVLKPPGMTSHDVVAFVRRLVGGGKVGHLGTLDPAATGVLPLALGAATRTLEFLPAARKAYRAEVTFGVETDTLDAEGQVLARHPVGDLTLEALQEACGRYLGTVMQEPPRVSALRQGGRRSYERARQGEDFRLPPRPAIYHEVRVLALDPAAGIALLDVDCGPGTYVRALARDLGRDLGCGAMLSFLVRTRSGPFLLPEAVTLEELRADGVPAHLLSVGAVLARSGLPPVQVDPELLAAGREAPACVAPGQVAPEPGDAVHLVEGMGASLGLGRVLAGPDLRVRVERVLVGGAAS